MSTAQKTLYIINIDFPPVSGPGIWRVLALAKYAAQSGVRVHVFCSDRSCWHDRHDESLLDQLPSLVQVTRIRSIFSKDLLDFFDRWKKSPSPIKRKIGRQLYWWISFYFPDPIFHWAIKGSLIALKYSTQEKPDAIFTTGPQHLVHTAGWLISKFRKSSCWIMDYRDPWAEDPAYDQVTHGPYQEKLAAWIEGKFIHKATFVTAVSNGFLSAIKDRFGKNENPEKFILIQNGHDLEILDSNPLSQPSESSNTPDKLIIHFNGTIQDGNNSFSHLIEAIAKFNTDQSVVQKIILSLCGADWRIEQQASALGLTEAIRDHGPLTQKRSQEVSRDADILLLTVRPDLATSSGVIPGKIYEALAIGKPVLALVPDPSDVRDILAADSGSRCVSPTNTEEILNALRWMYAQRNNSDISLQSDQIRKRINIASQFCRKDLSNKILKLAKLI